MNSDISTGTYNGLVDRIGEILALARNNLIRQINQTHVMAYWEIGRGIVEFEQKGKARAEYGKELIKRLSRDMAEKFGRGFSERNIEQMRKFYLEFPTQIRQTLSDESGKPQTLSAESREVLERQTMHCEFKPILSGSHYCELLKVDEPLARSFYEQEAVKNNWSVRELRRQTNSMLFERLAYSKDTKAVMEMAKKGQIIEKPEDAIKNPYVLEFLDLKEDISYTESRFEQAIIDKLQYFLLEMGNGFSFVARQKRITISNRHYYIDLVFYNRVLKCFVLIDLKAGELDHSDMGQMNFYLNYFKENEKSEGENDPVGLILCAGRDDVFAKYVLGGLSNKIFASKYKIALPSEQELRLKLKSISLSSSNNQQRWKKYQR